MRSGVELISSAHKCISTLEDDYLGTRWFSESNLPGKAGGIAARITKYVFLDVPVDYFSTILGHEFFGHGARYREFGIKGVHYYFMWPPPYGLGGGIADKDGVLPVSCQQLLAIWSGGLEVHPLINKNLGLRWMKNGQMNYREASQFFWSFQILWSYIQETDENLFNGVSDNDVRAYVRYLNSGTAYSDPTIIKMSVKDLKSKMLINIANPFFFLFSVYDLQYLPLGGQSVV